MKKAVHWSMPAGLLHSESARFRKYGSELFESLSEFSTVDHRAGEGMRAFLE